MPHKQEISDEMRAALASENPVDLVKALFRTARAHVPREARAPAAMPSAIVPPVSVPVAVRQALSAGNKIEAIRLYREHAGVGLKEAKEAVETLERQEGRDSSGLAPGEQPPTRDWVWLVGILAVIVGIGFYRYLK